MAESVVSLVERLEKAAEDEIRNEGAGRYCNRCGHDEGKCLPSCATALLREAASRLSSPEGTRGYVFQKALEEIKAISKSVRMDDQQVEMKEMGDIAHKALRQAASISSSAAAASSIPSLLDNSHEWTRQAGYAPGFGDVRHCLKCHVYSFEELAGKSCGGLASPRVSAATPAPIFDAAVAEGERIANEIAHRCPRFDWNPSDGNDSADPAEHIAANINALLDQLASSRVSAMPVPARFDCQECGVSKPIEDAVLCRKCCDDLLSVSAAERPAQTCETCQHFAEHGGQTDLAPGFDHLKTGDCNADEIIQLNSRGVVTYRGHSCKLHEPAPPGPVAPQENKS